MKEERMQGSDATTPRLRIYYGPDEPSVDAAPSPVHVNQVKLPLGEVFPLLADAIRSERGWLKDFADDEVQISTDLYEVLLAYQHYRRPTH